MGEAVQEVFESPDQRDVPLGSEESAGNLEKKNVSVVECKENLDILFHPFSAKDLRCLAAVRRVFIHFTSIDPLGEFTASELEILDDRIKRDSLSEVVVALVSHARGAPLRALARSLGGPRHSPLFPVTNVVERSTHCMCGDVAGSEVTIGDEELLLERGVLLDSFTDTLLEDGQAGYYLLIAVGKAVIARCLITPPRIGDGREMISKLKERQIPVQILSLGVSSAAHDFAAELGLTGEDVREIESALHLDTVLDSAESFVMLTSDPDCADYVRRRGLVCFFADQDRFENTPGVACIRSFDLRSLTTLFERARRELVRFRARGLLFAAVGIITIGVAFSVWQSF